MIKIESPSLGEKSKVFLNECEERRQSVAKLYEQLEQPPFGLRRGANAYPSVCGVASLRDGNRAV